MRVWGLGKKLGAYSDVIHVWLGVVSGAMGIWGSIIALIYLAYQSADRLLGEDSVEWQGDLVEFVVGYIIGSLGLR